MRTATAAVPAVNAYMLCAFFSTKQAEFVNSRWSYKFYLSNSSFLKFANYIPNNSQMMTSMNLYKCKCLVSI